MSMTKKLHNLQTKSENLTLLTLIILLTLVSVLFVTSCAKKKPELTPIRIGWQVAWAVQGQIAQSLKHTNIMELNGLKGGFKGFTYGAPLNEAALAGEIDVGFLGEQPAVSLIARNSKWKVVARLFNTRLAIIIPPESGITQIADLKGKTVAIPFGSTAHRLALRWLIDSGLTPNKDVQVINMDIAEQAGVVLAGTKKKWKGNIDALVSWDPNIAIFQNKGFAKILKYDLGLAVVVMSEDFMNKYPEAASAFLSAYIEAYYYYVINQRTANKWFAEEARIQFDPSILDIAASFEPNMKAQSIKSINVNITEDHVQSMQRGAEFGYSLKLTTVKPDMKTAIEGTLLPKALQKLQESPIDYSKVEVR